MATTSQLVVLVFLLGSLSFAETIPRMLELPLDHLQILARHGARHPLFLVPELSECPIGSLTPQGAIEERNFGKRMKSMYPDYISASKSNRMKSIDQNRCVDTAVQILAGMGVTSYSIDLMPEMNVSALSATDLRNFLSELDGFEVQLPACVQQLIRKTSKVIEGVVSPRIAQALRILFSIQVADSIDTLRQSGYNGLYYGLNMTECIPPEQALFDQVSFAKLTRFCMEQFCRPATRAVVKELKEFASKTSSTSGQNGGAKTLSVYGLNDVHILGYLKAILPGETHVRPHFGGYIIFETYGDDIRIKTGEAVYSEAKYRATLNIYEVINKLEMTLA